MKLLKSIFFLFIFGCFLFFLKSGSFHTPKIYDCFLFFNEFDLLEIRFEEMYSVVDKFVLVEALETFRGDPKPLYFEENKERFRKFADKIIYVPVKERFITNNPWDREKYQRDQILRGIKNCKKNDIIFISDVDEIVRKEKIEEIVAPLISKQQEVIVLEQKMYFGYLNRLQGLWRGTIATTYDQIKRLTPKIARKLRHIKPKRLRTSKISRIELIQEGGWHFTSLGGVNQYLDKIKAFSHAELDNAEYTRKENLIQVLKSCPVVPLDDSYPSFILSQQARYRQIGLLD